MDYIPARDTDFEAWAVNFGSYATTNFAALNMTSPEATAADNQAIAFTAALLLSTDPATRSAVTVEAKNQARIEALAVIRPLATRVSADPNVLSADKIALGVTVRTLVPTPIPAPVVSPIVILRNAQPFRQTLDYSYAGQIGKAKPFGSIGLEVYRVVGLAPAVDPEQAKFVGQVTKSPFVQNFVASEVGKVVTYFTRYNTRSGPAGQSQVGPWSAPLSVTVM